MGRSPVRTRKAAGSSAMRRSRSAVLPGPVAPAVAGSVAPVAAAASAWTGSLVTAVVVTAVVVTAVVVMWSVPLLA